MNMPLFIPNHQMRPDCPGDGYPDAVIWCVIASRRSLLVLREYRSGDPLKKYSLEAVCQKRATGNANAGGHHLFHDGVVAG